jgi:hypothetical protein
MFVTHELEPSLHTHFDLCKAVLVFAVKTREIGLRHRHL